MLGVYPSCSSVFMHWATQLTTLLNQIIHYPKFGSSPAHLVAIFDQARALASAFVADTTQDILWIGYRWCATRRSLAD